MAVHARFGRFPVFCLMLAACNSNNANPPSPELSAPGISATIPFNDHILVDQFGYLPDDSKVAVIRSPEVGYDATDKFAPGKSYELRDAMGGQVVFSAPPVAWRAGAVEPSSGDRGWWFDFSSVRAPGRYFVSDSQNNVRSAVFRIGPDVYTNVLKAAVRMYYYQRSGMAKLAQHAGTCWVDDASYAGPNQDLAAHDITDPNNKSKFRNVSGGWFDAGDTNKYVTSTFQTVNQLLTTYQQNPGAFTDDTGIPESGNGIPDLLDEVNWEIDWLKRMQNPDGSAALKVGETVYELASPPSSDHNMRYYIPRCTSSTIAVAGMFAHASYVLRSIPRLTAEADDLRTRAVAAWDSFQSTTPKQENCDSGVIHAARADWSAADQNSAAVVSAVYLYAITGTAEYSDYVRRHYRETRPYHDFGWSRYQPEQGDALLFYATLPSADAMTRTAILADKAADMRAAPEVYRFNPDDDLYRDYMHDAQYHWGSNAPRAAYGNTNLDVIAYHLDPGHDPDYRLRALEVLHYFHGVNPFALVYLSNMYPYGVTRSVREIYHTWFTHGSKWSDALTSVCGPPPGYVPGGPSAHADTDGVPATLRPPVGQPPQKSYRDWNVAYPENSWTVTEPSINYQSGYIRLVSGFVQPARQDP